jgi:hypothetical protein
MKTQQHDKQDDDRRPSPTGCAKELIVEQGRPWHGFRLAYVHLLGGVRAWYWIARRPPHPGSGAVKRAYHNALGIHIGVPGLGG